MAEVGRLESCKAEVMRRLIKDKWSDVEAVCAASHLLTPAIPPMFDAAVSDTRAPNSGQVYPFLASAHASQQCQLGVADTEKLHVGRLNMRYMHGLLVICRHTSQLAWHQCACASIIEAAFM
jgi:hypothetical protein